MIVALLTATAAMSQPLDDRWGTKSTAVTTSTEETGLATYVQSSTAVVSYKGDNGELSAAMSESAFLQFLFYAFCSNMISAVCFLLYKCYKERCRAYNFDQDYIPTSESSDSSYDSEGDIQSIEAVLLERDLAISETIPRKETALQLRNREIDHPLRIRKDEEPRIPKVIPLPSAEFVEKPNYPKDGNPLFKYETTSL